MARQSGELSCYVFDKVLCSSPIYNPYGFQSINRGIWESILDYSLALDRLKVFHEHFPAVSPVRKLRRHARAFAISFSAFGRSYRQPACVASRGR